MSIYQPQQQPGLYGLHIPYNQGYDARSRANAPTADQKGASGYLRRPDGSQIGLWVTDISADFSVSGVSAQSRMLREFFPRSFNDVTLRVTGNVASTQEYNRLAAFVREHHWKALQYVNQGGSATQTLTFGLYNNTPSSWRPARRSTDVAITGESAPVGLTNVKGGHRPWIVNGYVRSIAAGARHWEVAPEISFEFVVCESTLNGNTGIWGDSFDNGGSTLKTMLQLLGIANGGARTQGKGFIQDPLASPSPPLKTSPAQAVQQVVTQVGQDLNWAVQAASRIL